MGKLLTGRVIKIIDKYKLVINKGSQDGVSVYDRFLIYHLGEKMIDPDTKENLGTLELVCGEGKPEHIQDHITTLVTAKESVKKTKTVMKNGAFSIMYGTTRETYEPVVTMEPFENADTDCLFKQIK